jgi:hypothetical protein
MDRDREQIKLLSIFHYVVGGLAALFSCTLIIHIAMGVAMLAGGFEGDDAPPEIFGWFFILFPAAFMLCGWALAVCIIVAGRRLSQFRSRTYCLVIAAIECCFMPFGTVLGVFTIIVLMRESVRELFAANQAFNRTGQGPAA